MKNKLLLLVSLFALTTSCSHELEKVIVETYPGGSPELEQYFMVKGETRTLVKEIGYYPEGQKRIEGNYLQDKRTGRWTYWYENGNKWSEAEYVAEIRHGKSIVWHENGKKYYEGNYMNGERAGEWQFWDEEGNLTKEIDYNE
ncbi:MAG: hypothetical protein U1C46_07000 [Bacteroidales bacterium]|nr:hypothetical protein [Bacteroidales bacterium]MDZ4204550.1 hypothetical protein [Bacteroidales bacterium]